MRKFIGQIMSSKLSEAMKWALHSSDFEAVATEHGRSADSLKQVVYRQRHITQGNFKAIEQLVGIAIKNQNEIGSTLTEYEEILQRGEPVQDR
jgi:hypothetical protein